MKVFMRMVSCPGSNCLMLSWIMELFRTINVLHETMCSRTFTWAPTFQVSVTCDVLKSEFNASVLMAVSGL